MKSKTVEILLAEDCPGDARLTEEALKDAQVENELNVVTNGEEALAYLRREGVHQNATRPDLVLLDLNMPKLSGREVLEEMKKDPDLWSIPVVVLTTSSAEQDIVEVYRLGGNCYIEKPLELDRFIDVVKAIESFWFSIASLPSTRMAG